MEAIYPNIVAERVRRGMSQSDLARQMNVTRKTIYNWENAGNIPASAVDKLSIFFKVSADYLLNSNQSKEERRNPMDSEERVRGQRTLIQAEFERMVETGKENRVKRKSLALKLVQTAAEQGISVEEFLSVLETARRIAMSGRLNPPD